MNIEADVQKMLEQMCATQYDTEFTIENSKKEKVPSEYEVQINKIKSSIEKLESKLYKKELNHIAELRKEYEQDSKKIENKYYKTFHDEYIFVKEISLVYNKNSYKIFDMYYNGEYVYKNCDGEFIIYTDYEGILKNSNKEVSEDEFLNVMKEAIKYLTNKFLTNK